MRNIINGFLAVRCFARWNSDPEWTYLGIGKVMGYSDSQLVYDKDGAATTCLGFELNCKDSITDPTFINNFDNTFEEGIPDVKEGKEKYVRHKTRERSTEIVKKKKREFQQFAILILMIPMVIEAMGLQNAITISPYMKKKKRE